MSLSVECWWSIAKWTEEADLNIRAVVSKNDSSSIVCDVRFSDAVN